MIRKNDPNSDFWQLAEKVSRKVDGFPPWKLGRLEQADFKVGDRVIVKSRGLEECEGIVREVGGLLPDSLYVETDSGFVYVRPSELELAPELEQRCGACRKVYRMNESLEVLRILARGSWTYPEMHLHFELHFKGARVLYRLPSAATLGVLIELGLIQQMSGVYELTDLGRAFVVLMSAQEGA